MNAAGFPILSLITWLPLVGCVVIMSVRGDEETVASNARWTALWTSLLVLAVSLVLWAKFDPREPGFQFMFPAQPAKRPVAFVPVRVFASLPPQ